MHVVLDIECQEEITPSICQHPAICTAAAAPPITQHHMLPSGAAAAGSSTSEQATSGLVDTDKDTWGSPWFTRPLALLQQVERRAGVSRETFESEVSTLRTPVVLTGEGLDELTAHLGWATHIA